MSIGLGLGALTAGLLAASSFAPGVTATAGERTCWSIEPIELGLDGVWSYTYEVSWCAEGAEIVSVDPVVTYEVIAPVCRWVGSVEESVTKSEEGTRTAFNLSEFSCPGDIGAKGVTPWAIVTVHADGTYTVDATGIRP
ncbi:hypothetical protein [Amycolatopsis sp. NPDC098790]|uniref:hypothetical protein n=1 Tax=Amycolatopsis sp. NPDC098790 TaxID=3363939 RepID=UPI0038160E0D